MTPYDLELDYDYWNYRMRVRVITYPLKRTASDKMLEEIMSAVLPEDEQEELPTGFSCIGHIGMYFAAFSLYYEDLYNPMKKELVLILFFSKRT